MRESAQSWRELLVDIKARGLAAAPEIAVGDGAMGFWKALDEVFPGARHQRCWVHKAANVLNKVPRSVQPGMKAALREVRDAPDRAAARAAVVVFVEKYGAKYPKAVECLLKDQEALLAFFDFPAEHWDHLRTANPVESVFATVRHRTVRTKGALSQTTARLMVFKLVMAASKTWRRLKGREPLAHAPRRRHLHRRRRHHGGARSPRRLIGPRHPKSAIAPSYMRSYTMGQDGQPFSLRYTQLDRNGCWRYRRRVPDWLRSLLRKTEFVKVLGRTEADALRNFGPDHRHVETILAHGRPLGGADTFLDVRRQAMATVREMGWDPNRGRAEVNPEEAEAETPSWTASSRPTRPATPRVAHRGLRTCLTMTTWCWPSCRGAPPG